MLCLHKESSDFNLGFSRKLHAFHGSGCYVKLIVKLLHFTIYVLNLDNEISKNIGIHYVAHEKTDYIDKHFKASCRLNIITIHFQDYGIRRQKILVKEEV